MLGLVHDVNVSRAPARVRARHAEHAEHVARTEHNAAANKNSRRGFLLVPRYLELGQRLLNERRRQENREVRGETASDSPHQNKGGVGPDDGVRDDAPAEELGPRGGNYLGQPRPPRRGPRGAPTPGARNSPVLRPERTTPIPLRLPIEILRDKLVPGGRPVGQSGSSPDIREVHTLRDPLNTAFQYFQFLTENGTIGTRVPPGRYPGAGVVLPGGNGFIGIRPYSTSGPPTIDIHIRGVPFREIKFLSLF